MYTQRMLGRLGILLLLLTGGVLLSIMTPACGKAQDDPIVVKYWDFGGPDSPLGDAVDEIRVTPDGTGRYLHFEGGSIYWSPDSGAHVIWGDIRQKWANMGWERSVLGYPTSDELPTSDGEGRYNRFQEGAIFWHPSIGAYETHGYISKKWLDLGAERNLGYPLTDELSTPDGQGRYSVFRPRRDLLAPGNWRKRSAWCRPRRMGSTRGRTQRPRLSSQ